MANFVEKSHVFVNEDVKTCDDALKFLAKKATELDAANDEKTVYEAFAAREKVATTGMVGSVAIPHAKSAAIAHPSVVVARFNNVADWKCTDDSDVKLAIALLIPEGEAGALHLKNLSKIATMLNTDGAAAKLLAAKDADELADLLNASLEA